MPTYKKSEEWLHQSSLLLEARPATTRITTRYSLAPSRRRPSKKQAEAEAAAAPRPPRAELVLKTYDPVSGAALKYRTSKAAEVSRLVQMLGGLSRRMAGAPEPDAPLAAALVPDEPMPDAPPAPQAGEGAAGGPAGPPQQQGGGGGKGKKKRGKR